MQKIREQKLAYHITKIMVYQGNKIANRDQHVSIQYQASNNDTSLLHTLIISQMGPWICREATVFFCGNPVQSLCKLTQILKDYYRSL